MKRKAEYELNREEFDANHRNLTPPNQGKIKNHENGHSHNSGVLVNSLNGLNNEINHGIKNSKQNLGSHNLVNSDDFADKTGKIEGNNNKDHKENEQKSHNGLFHKDMVNIDKIITPQGPENPSNDSMNNNTNWEVDINTYLEKYKTSISSKVDKSKIRCKIIKNNENGYIKAGELIRNGELVSFPTETVYGLGANATNETAVVRIYETKNRPLSDPVIVHVISKQQALEFVEIDDETISLFEYLTDKFWPGPLTLVLKANLDKIPMVVTANTGYVGVRYPKQKTAQALIHSSQRPIAAPSANLFSHVSPTSSIHVFNDLHDKDIYIIDGEQCSLGIESTVIKLMKIENNLCIYLLRVGSVSEKSIRNAIQESSLFNNVEIRRVKKEHTVAININVEAPGQLLKHYSPYIETYLLEYCDEKEFGGNEINIRMEKSIILDFNNIALTHKKSCLHYFTLSETGNMKEAMVKLYDLLRQAEEIKDAEAILIINLQAYSEKYKSQIEELPEFLETVYDKSFRSASGKKIFFNVKSDKFYMKS